MTICYYYYNWKNVSMKNWRFQKARTTFKYPQIVNEKNKKYMVWASMNKFQMPELSITINILST